MVRGSILFICWRWSMKMWLGFFVAASVALGSGPGPEKTGKKNGPLPQARQDGSEIKGIEVRFVNGSTVMMVMLENKIDIDTEFGKLSIVPKNIRQIDFGLRLSPETAAKI